MINEKEFMEETDVIEENDYYDNLAIDAGYDTWEGMYFRVTAA